MDGWLTEGTHVFKLIRFAWIEETQFVVSNKKNMGRLDNNC